MRKRFLGIPVSVLIAGLVFLLVGGGIMAAINYLDRDVSVSVSIVGIDACEAYADEEMTIPLAELAFGDIMAGEASANVTFWIVNESDATGYPFYITLSTTGIDPLLVMTETTSGVIPEDPGSLALVVGSDYEPGYWEAGMPSTNILGGIDASVTTIEVASIDGFDAAPGELWCEGEVIGYAGLRAYEAEGAGTDEVPAHWAETEVTTTLSEGFEILAHEFGLDGRLFPEPAGTIVIDEEILSYTIANYHDSSDMQVCQGVTRGLEETTPAIHYAGAIVTLLEWVETVEAVPGSPEVLAAFTGCTRGAEGTVAAVHADGTEISVAEWVGETGEDLFGLEPGAVLACSVYLEADAGISRGDYPFILTIEAQN